MKKLIIASDNTHKVEEIKKLLSKLNYNIVTKSEVGLGDLEVEETEDTLEGNALLKAKAIYNRTKDAFVISDDTGLFVESLEGKPGVHSARYAGQSHDDEKNRLKLLREMEGFENRNAYFKTVVALITDTGDFYILEGRCDGSIEETEKGTDGFGYDCIFKPKGYDKSFGEMGVEEKNKISHRRNALNNLLEKLKEL